MPVNDWMQILPIILPLSVPPMRSDCANPVHFRVSSACERSIRLSIELPFKGWNSGLPVLSVFYFHNKDSSKGEGGRNQLHYLDDQVGNVAFWVVWKATLWCDYVPLSRREEGCEDGGPWAIPDVLGDRWVNSVVLEHCTGDHVEGHIRHQMIADCRCRHYLTLSQLQYG